ncbi:hypothetical protein BVI1335_1010044 [Burkholderia vietnamiensis]|nr:hypothetical protein BVI1335_1010044 [Burkholderia vietnamiensis]
MWRRHVPGQARGGRQERGSAAQAAARPPVAARCRMRECDARVAFGVRAGGASVRGGLRAM